jgi:hypothetical protein
MVNSAVIYCGMTVGMHNQLGSTLTEKRNSLMRFSVSALLFLNKQLTTGLLHNWCPEIVTSTSEIDKLVVILLRDTADLIKGYIDASETILM